MLGPLKLARPFASVATVDERRTVEAGSITGGGHLDAGHGHVGPVGILKLHGRLLGQRLAGGGAGGGGLGEAEPPAERLHRRGRNIGVVLALQPRLVEPAYGGDEMNASCWA